ncbi:MAG: PAS domain S-box protein [Rhodocyclaceae bacterium]|nr:PAS domain S-box protein [Rhodocyclaceae bacterium]
MNPRFRRIFQAAGVAAGWPWVLPRLAFVLFAGAVLGLFWLTERSDREEQRATLISDVLWLEQDLRFHLVRNEERLGQIQTRQAGNPALFENLARVLLANGTGLRQIMWVNAEGSVIRALPAPTDGYLVGEASGAVPSVETFRLARSLGKPAYGPAYPIVDDDWQFEVHVPVFENGVFSGMSVGAYSIRAILDSAVPWWLAERYRIQIRDNTSALLGSRTKVSAETREGDYEIPFDPPGRGISILAVPYRTPASPASRILSAAVGVLAVLVLASFWALRRHVQGRLAAEQALRAEHQFRKAMENSVETGLRARDLQGRITYVNPAFCRMVGWGAEELVGRGPPMPYWAEDELEATRKIHDRILSGHGPEAGFEIRLKHRDGHVFWVLIHEAPLIDENGMQTGWMGSVVDVTDRKRVEELARQHQERIQASARLVAMGEMASSIAHEINQPLAAIASYNAGCLNLLKSGQVDVDGLTGALGKSVEQAQRAGRIIRRIYEFVRRSEPRSEPIQVAQFVDEAISMTRADAARLGLRIDVRTEENLPSLTGDRVLLAQALFNLLRNAVDSMRDAAAADPSIGILVRTVNEGIEVGVADRGTGISREAAARLFEPFYTTKAEGMGMGLKITRSIIESHHGRLWYEENIGGGSTFKFFLPASHR